VSAPHQITAAQRVAILYRLRQWVKLSAGEGLDSEADDVGLGWLDCEQCDETQQQQFGCWRFGNRLKAEHPLPIDYTGNTSHDSVMFCPKACLDEEHSPEGQPLPSDFFEALERAKKIRAFGGPDRFEGQPPSDLPTRYVWFWATLEGVVSRFQSEVKDSQAKLNAKVARSINRRLSLRSGE
jgi:hypothetical protein